MRSSSHKGIFTGIGVSTLLCWVTCVAIAITLYLVLFYTPGGKTVRAAQRIFYVHISFIWIAFLALLIVMITSIVYLITTFQKWDHIAKASAEIGALFCTLGLITGSLWVKPIWNVWWTWDSWLTTTFVLWLIYVAYLMLRRSVKREWGLRGAAVFGLIAFFALPLIYFSIRWWRSLHPAPVIIWESSLDLEIEALATLLVCVITFTLLFFYLFQHRVAIDRMEDELEKIRRTLVAREQGMRDFLVENQDFIIEDYTFKEYEKHE